MSNKTVMSNKRQRKVKTYFDKLGHESVINDSLKRFKVKVFNGAIAILIVQLHERFQSMFLISEIFSFLRPADNLIKMSDEQLVESVSKFHGNYDVVTSALFTEVKCFRNTKRDEIRNRKTVNVKELAKYFLIENKLVARSLPNLCTSFLMYLTLPVTTASSECSFS